MRIIIGFGMLMIWFNSCNNSKHGNMYAFDLDSLEREELKITLINDSNQLKWIIDDYKSFWTPTNDQMIAIDSIIVKGIRENHKHFYKRLNSTSYKNYYRQYACYSTNNGDSMVYLRAMCRVGDSDWQHVFRTVSDGGDCYWHIWINFTKRKYVKYIVHGLA